jgi:hypothetical protein
MVIMLQCGTCRLVAAYLRDNKVSGTKFKTWRRPPGLLDCLMGRTERIYKTKILNGERKAYGVGPTPEASQQAAKKNWDKNSGREAT